MNNPGRSQPRRTPSDSARPNMGLGSTCKARWRTRSPTPLAQEARACSASSPWAMDTRQPCSPFPCRLSRLLTIRHRHSLRRAWVARGQVGETGPRQATSHLRTTRCQFGRTRRCSSGESDPFLEAPNPTQLRRVLSPSRFPFPFLLRRCGADLQSCWGSRSYVYDAGGTIGVPSLVMGTAEAEATGLEDEVPCFVPGHGCSWFAQVRKPVRRRHSQCKHPGGVPGRLGPTPIDPLAVSRFHWIDSMDRFHVARGCWLYPAREGTGDQWWYNTCSINRQGSSSG